RQLSYSAEDHDELIGYETEQGSAVWKNWARRVHREDREGTWDRIRRGISERTDFELDYRTVNPDGSIKYVHALGQPVFNAAGDLVEFVGTSIDVTQRRRAEEARLDAQ